MNKSKILKDLARRNGLCDEWYSKWNDNCSEDELLDKAIMGLNFLFQKNYPDIEIIRKFFDKDNLKKHNIFLDDNIWIANPCSSTQEEKRALFVGNTNGVVRIDGYNIADLFIMNDCDITIECCNLSKVFINIADNAKVHVVQEDAASVYVYLKDNSTCTTSGDVKIRDRR